MCYNLCLSRMYSVLPHRDCMAHAVADCWSFLPSADLWVIEDASSGRHFSKVIIGYAMDFYHKPSWCKVAWDLLQLQGMQIWSGVTSWKPCSAARIREVVHYFEHCLESLLSWAGKVKCLQPYCCSCVWLSCLSSYWKEIWHKCHVFLRLAHLSGRILFLCMSPCLKVNLHSRTR